MSPTVFKRTLPPAIPASEPLPALCVVMSNDPLLSMEVVDALRERARDEGFTEKHHYVMEARSDWSVLLSAGGSGSLFGDRQWIEIALPGGKPGKTGAEVLVQLAQKIKQPAADDVMTVIRLPGLDRATRESRWAKTLFGAARVIEKADISRPALPDWISQRLASQGQTLSEQMRQWLADRVEGNLLAAHQEIQKLGLLYPEGEISEAQCQSAVMNVARYDVFALRDAMLEGDKSRMLRVLWGLKAEGEALPLVLWSLSEEIRSLQRASQAIYEGQPIGGALKAARLFGARETRARRALERVPLKRWTRAVEHAHDVDRLIKGIPVPERLSDPWEEIARMAMGIAASRAG